MVEISEKCRKKRLHLTETEDEGSRTHFSLKSLRHQRLENVDAARATPFHARDSMTAPFLSRRQWLQTAGASSLALTTPDFLLAHGQDKTSALAPLNRYPRMVQEWYVSEVESALVLRGLVDFFKLKTKDEAEA
jgi:hypothetical protein